MEYNNSVTLKDGRACTLRNGTASDGQALLDEFNLTHEQTDFLLTYPGEHSYTAEQEAAFLQRNQLCRTQRKDQASCRIWHQCG